MSESVNHSAGRRAKEQWHEERDVSYRPVVTALIGLLALLVLAVILSRFVFAYLIAQRPGPLETPLAQRFGRQVPPEPRLQSDPLADLARLHAEEDTILQGYGWVDRGAGVVRIPIERAMDLMVQTNPGRMGGEEKR